MQWVRSGHETMHLTCNHRQDHYHKMVFTINLQKMLIQRSRSNPARAADVWSHVNAVFGKNAKCHTTPMDSLALNSINDHFQSVALSSDDKSAVTFVTILLY